VAQQGDMEEGYMDARIQEYRKKKP